jgi:hypothetical protein
MGWEGALVRFRISFALPEVQSCNDHITGNLRRAEGTIPYEVFILKIRTVSSKSFDTEEAYQFYDITGPFIGQRKGFLFYLVTR